MSIADTWSDDAFIRLMKDLIGNEGDIYGASKNIEREPVTETNSHSEGSLVSLQR